MKSHLQQPTAQLGSAHHFERGEHQANITVDDFNPRWIMLQLESAHILLIKSKKRICPYSWDEAC